MNAGLENVSTNSMGCITNNLLEGTDHVLYHQHYMPGCEEVISPELRGKILYIIEGVGELCKEDKQCLKTLEPGKVIYLPHKENYIVKNIGKIFLNFLVISRVSPDPREEECGLTLPSLLLRFFREGKEYFESGVVFIHNDLHPELPTLQLPIKVSDIEITNKKSTDWKQLDRDISHLVIKGKGLITIKNQLPEEICEGDVVSIPSGVEWKIKNLKNRCLNIVTVHDVKQ